MTKQFQKLSIIIPVYNEGRLIARAIALVLAADTLGLRKEIIIVDDGSTDQTAKILSHLKKRHRQLIVMRQPKNYGKGAAVKLGLLSSSGDIVLIQDADLEYSPEDYPLLLRPIIDHRADVVYGSRFISHKPHRVLYFWHYVVNKLLTTFSNIMTNLNLTDMETGYKVFQGELVRRLANELSSQRFGFEPEITAKIAKISNLRLYEVGISYYGRTYAEGKKINWFDGFKAVMAIIRFNLFDNFI